MSSLPNKFLLFSRMSLNVKVGKFSIHSQESIEFMKNLGPDEYVLQIMQEGLKLDFDEIPPPYWEPNNASCLNNLSTAQSKVNKWLEQGIVY